MIAALILTTAALVCLAILLGDEKPRPTVWLATEDDHAWHKILVARERAKVHTLRHTREAARRRYEFVTWPAICWEVRRREIESDMAEARKARHLENLGGVA